jgi:hypothetical protein
MIKSDTITDLKFIDKVINVIADNDKGRCSTGTVKIWLEYVEDVLDEHDAHLVYDYYYAI